MAKAETQRRFYYALRAAGLCVSCKQPSPATVRCPSCRAAERQRQRRRRKHYRAARHCVECSKPPVPGHVRCAACMARRSAYKRRKRQSTRLGFCSNCPRPLDEVGFRSCSRCREKIRVCRIAREEKRRLQGFCIRGDHLNDTPDYRFCSACRHRMRSAIRTKP